MYAAGHRRNAALNEGRDQVQVSLLHALMAVSYPRSPQVQDLTVPTRPLGERKQGLFGQQAPCPLSRHAAPPSTLQIRELSSSHAKRLYRMLG